MVDVMYSLEGKIRTFHFIRRSNSYFLTQNCSIFEYLLFLSDFDANGIYYFYYLEVLWAQCSSFPIAFSWEFCKFGFMRSQFLLIRAAVFFSCLDSEMTSLWCGQFKLCLPVWYPLKYKTEYPDLDFLWQKRFAGLGKTEKTDKLWRWVFIVMWMARYGKKWWFLMRDGMEKGEKVWMRRLVEGGKVF